MKQITIGMLLLALTTGVTGCSSMMNGCISMEMGVRNRILAQKAWGHWSWCYDKLDYPIHFAKGFRQGYRNILDGGNGCQPTLPPQCYWKPQFQTAKGRCMTHSWFDGFSHGALAAKQDGYGSLGEIPISPTARTNIEVARSRPTQNLFDGSNPHYGAGAWDGGAGDGGVTDPPGPDANLIPVLPDQQPGLPVPVRPYE